MDVYTIVTSQIMDLLEENQIPWRKPWKSAGEARNLITQKPYRGINKFLLNCSPYTSPYWLTFRQIQAKNGRLEKGSKSQLVVFYKWIDSKDSDEEVNGGEKNQKGRCRYSGTTGSSISTK